MSELFITEKTFDKIDYTKHPLEKADYEACTFSNCNFLSSDLSHFRFTDCVFISCDLSAVRLNKTGFQNVHFRSCKLLGLHFDYCSDFLFEVNFENCSLNLSSFYKKKLKKMRFTNCSLHEADFAEADLSQACFEQCDLHKALFENTNMEKADFISSLNYSINPEANLLKKAKFSLPAVIGLLDKYEIEIYPSAS